MDQTDQRPLLRHHLGFRRQRAQGKAIDDDRDALGQGKKPRQRLGALLRRWPRKALAQRADINLPAQPAQSGNQTPIIGIASAGRRKIARHRKSDALHHRGAS